MGSYHGTFNSMNNANNGWRSTARQGGFGGMLFDGTAGYIAFNSQTVTTQFTWAFWYNFNATGSYYGPLGNAANNTGVFFNAVNNASVAIGGSTNGINAYRNIPANASVGVWNHILATFDGTTVIAYSNGKQVGSQALSAPVYNNLSTIGQSGGGSNFFNGYLDDIRIYNRVLSAAEVFDLYENSKVGYPRLLNQTKTSLPVLISFALSAGSAPASSTDSGTGIASCPTVGSAVGSSTDSATAIAQWLAVGTDVSGSSSSATSTPGITHSLGYTFSFSNTTKCGVVQKFSSDIRLYSFDFSGMEEISQGGDTIASIQSLTASPSSLNVGIPSIVGNTVQVVLGGGSDNTLYTIPVVINTSSNAILEGVGLLYVR